MSQKYYEMVINPFYLKNLINISQFEDIRLKGFGYDGKLGLFFTKNETFVKTKLYWPSGIIKSKNSTQSVGWF